MNSFVMKAIAFFLFSSLFCSIGQAQLPSGWSQGDIGSVGVNGSGSYANGTFTVQGAGTQIWGTADAFHFVYEALPGDGVFVARVVSITGNSSYGAAGVMIRETLDAGSKNAKTADWPAYNAIYFDFRSTVGGITYEPGGASSTLPYWVKVVRIGTNFSSYRSSDGVSWTQIGSTQTISMAQNVYVGLAVTSGSTTGLATATFDNVSLAPPPPFINSLTPTNGEPGTTVTIQGLDFTSTTGTVTFHGQTATVSNWSDRSITATVPNGVTSGNVVVTAGGLSSNGVWFGVLRPAIASLTPTAGMAGTSVIIGGNHFGSSAGSVSFNGQSASISGWSDNSITAVVPSSATTGSVVVTTAGSLPSNGMNFIVGPYISSLTPASGNSGTSVSAGGANLGSAAGTVTFNGLQAVISSWTNSSIASTVPNNAHSGPFVATLPGGGAAVSGPTFVVPTVNGVWDEADIGTVGAAGSTTVSSGAYTVRAYSGRLGGTADSLHFLYQPVSGDFDLILRVNVQTWSDYYNMQHGITVRDSLAPGGLSYSCLGQLGGYTATAARTSVNGSGTDQASYTGLANPGWLRVKRYGNTFVCFVSNNGTSWSKWSQTMVPVSPNALVGASVMSSNLTLAQVVFDNISLTPQVGGAIPSPWLVQDMGTNSGPGEATYNNGVFTVSSNSDVLRSSASDNATYIYQPVSGDLDIRAHVTWDSLISASGAAAGLMVRQSLAPDDLEFSCIVDQSSNRGYAESRLVAGANNSDYPFTSSAISWIRLVRRGALFDCYSSTDGTNWTLGGSSATELNLPSNVEVGLVQSSGSGQPISVATFDTVTINGIAPVPGPWQQQDIGSVTAPGDATLSSGVFTIESNSYDIGGSSDNLHYVYQQSGGDLNITARVTWQQWANLSGNVKSGVMVRQSLGAADLQFSCLLATQGYVYAVWRTSSGAADQTAMLYSPSPSWVKITRQGNNFTCYASSNGTSWSTVQTATVAMSANVYVGFAQSSYDGSYSLSTVDNLTLQGNLPTVAMTYPVSGSTVYMSVPVVLTATATPSPGASVSQVQYFDGQTLLGQAVSPPYSLNIGVLPAGSHTFTAQVTDSAGLQAVSVADTATLSNPKITSVTPDHGKPGTKVAIHGIGFGSSASGVVVSFGGVSGFITGFNDSEIDAIVPSGSGNGMMGVGWPDGSNADGAPPFGPCSGYCVTSFTLSPSVIPGDGSTGVTGSVVITGPAKLYGQRMSSPDIRAGMAMLIAALCADGVSTIGDAYQIDKGYERIDERLRGLGAHIERVEGF